MPEDVKTLLIVQYASLGTLNGGTVGLWKGTLEDGQVDYAMIHEPDAPEPEYLGSLSEEDAIDDRHAILGALTKFRALLEMMSEEKEADGPE